jgi:SAM-dependent methyltransferase
MSTSGVHARFVGSIPDYYERYLAPLLFAPYARDLACRVEIGATSRILELAAGTGQLTRELVSVMEPGARLVATDLNGPMLEVARQMVRDPRVEWREADATALPFEAGTFDEVVCQFGVHHFPDKVAAAAEVRRVLRRGRAYHFSAWSSVADNPLARIAQETTAACFPENPPTYYSVPWGYCDTRQIESDLRAGGFRHVSIQPVNFIARAPSADHAAIGIVQGTPMAQAVVERGIISAEAFAAIIAAVLTRELGGGPIAIPMRAWVVRAE